MEMSARGVKLGSGEPFAAILLPPDERTLSDRADWFGWCRYCCKSRKLRRSEFLVKPQKANRSLPFGAEKETHEGIKLPSTVPSSKCHARNRQLSLCSCIAPAPVPAGVIPHGCAFSRTD